MINKFSGFSDEELTFIDGAIEFLVSDEHEGWSYPDEQKRAHQLRSHIKFERAVRELSLTKSGETATV